MPMPRDASARGSIWTRTAYFCEPKTWTCETPSTIEMRWAIRVSPYSFRADSGSVGLVRARYRMGWSAGLSLK
jgi:hypothetical protein